MKLNQEGAFQYENGKCGSQSKRPSRSEQPPNYSTEISLRHPRTLPHTIVSTYSAQEARTPNRSQRVFVMPSISFLVTRIASKGLIRLRGLSCVFAKRCTGVTLVLQSPPVVFDD